MQRGGGVEGGSLTLKHQARAGPAPAARPSRRETGCRGDAALADVLDRDHHVRELAALTGGRHRDYRDDGHHGALERLEIQGDPDSR